MLSKMMVDIPSYSGFRIAMTCSPMASVLPQVRRGIVILMLVYSNVFERVEDLA
jgi:hypothetical protein